MGARRINGLKKKKRLAHRKSRQADQQKQKETAPAEPVQRKR